MTPSDSGSSRIETTETIYAAARGDSTTKKNRRENVRWNKTGDIKAVGFEKKSFEVLEIGTEDIPSCMSFAITGCLRMFLVMGVTAILVAKMNRYVDDERSKWKSNQTNFYTTMTKIYKSTRILNGQH